MRLLLRQYLDTLKGQYSHILIDLLPALPGDAHSQCAGRCKQDHHSRSGGVSARQRAGTAALHGKQGKAADQPLSSQIDGILLTMVDSRTNFAKEISALLRETYGSKIKGIRHQHSPLLSGLKEIKRRRKAAISCPLLRLQGG